MILQHSKKESIADLELHTFVQLTGPGHRDEQRVDIVVEAGLTSSYLSLFIISTLNIHCAVRIKYQIYSTTCFQCEVSLVTLFIIGFLKCFYFGYI